MSAVIAVPTLLFPRFAAPGRIGSDLLIPPSPPAERRREWQRFLRRYLPTYTGRMPQTQADFAVQGLINGGLVNDGHAMVDGGIIRAHVALTPPPTTNMVGWWKADANVYSDAGTTLCTDGTTVQQWNDQNTSAHNLAQATSGQRPTFNTNQLNSLPMVKFGVSATTFVEVAFSISGPCHLFLACKVLTISGNGNIVFDGVNIATMQAFYRTGPTLAVFTGTNQINGPSITANTAYIVEVKVNGTSSLVQVNHAAAATGTLDNVALGGMHFGNKVGGTMSSQFLQLGEGILYSAVQSSGNVSIIKNYLNDITRWNIDPGHTY